MSPRLTALSLRDLQIFFHAANTQSYSVTAETFGLTHAGISKSIKRFENALGAKMFERSGRGVALNLAGRTIYRQTKSVSDLINLMHMQITDLEVATKGLIRLGTSSAMTDGVVLPAIARLIADKSAIQIDLQTQTSGRLLQDLQSGLLDIAVAIVPAKISRDLKFDRLGSKRNVIVARRGHPLLEKSFALQDLGQQKWLLAPQHAQWISNIFDNAGLNPPSIVVRTDATPSLFAKLVAKSNLLAVMDPSLLEPRIAATLSIFPAPAPTSDINFGVFWRRNAFFSEAMKRCRRELKRAYRQAID